MQQQLADVLFHDALVVHELLQFLQVLLRIECYADALSAVTSCATRLLIVSLQGFRYVIVYDKAHIGLVYAHSEGYRGADDINAFHEEIVLRLVSYGVVQAGMICCRLYVVGHQHFCQLLHLLA